MNAKTLPVLAVLLGWSTIMSAQTSAQVQRGHTLFRANCGGCHSVACNRLGPKLEGIFGRRAGSVVDFKGYSAELQASGIVWTDQTLDAFLADPAKRVPGTTMTYGRIEGAAARRDLIAYLRREDRSFDLCQ